jgi:hypothetical protein
MTILLDRTTANEAVYIRADLVCHTSTSLATKRQTIHCVAYWSRKSQNAAFHEKAGVCQIFRGKTQRESRKKAARSPANAAGSSAGAKCPPREKTVHR